MIKYLDFNIAEPYRDGNRTNLNWETFHKYRKEVKISKNFNDYLKGKSVVIVGPSPYLEGKSKGKFIDSFDVVIRMNKGWKIPPTQIKDYGSKTNIRWHCMMEHPNNGGAFEIDNMVNAGPNLKMSKEDSLNKSKPDYLSNKWYFNESKVNY